MHVAEHTNKTRSSFHSSSTYGGSRPSAHAPAAHAAKSTNPQKNSRGNVAIKPTINDPFVIIIVWSFFYNIHHPSIHGKKHQARSYTHITHLKHVLAMYILWHFKIPLVDNGNAAVLLCQC